MEKSSRLDETLLKSGTQYLAPRHDYRLYREIQHFATWGRKFFVRKLVFNAAHFLEIDTQAFHPMR
jgi:hypothetical protein